MDNENTALYKETLFDKIFKPRSSRWKTDTPSAAPEAAPRSL